MTGEWDEAMKTDYNFENCTDAFKRQTRSLWPKKTKRIEALLRRFAPREFHLRLILSGTPDKHQIRALLTLPRDTIMAEVSGHALKEDLELLSEKLAVGICQYKDSIRRQALRQRKARREREFQSITPWLDADQEIEDRRAFMHLLRHMTKRLRSIVWHELITAQLQGQIPVGQVTVGDILDEVMVQAWEDYGQRPPDVPMDQWLMQLVHSVLDRYIQDGTMTLSFDEALDATDRYYELDTSWVEDNDPAWEPELITFDDILPDQEVGEPWQVLADEEQKRWIISRMSTLPKAQRRAFTCFAMEGLQPQEIARLQGRPVAEIEQDIHCVREHLKQALSRQALANA